MNTRDEQIAAIRKRIGRLRQDRLTSCYDEITQAYKAESVVERLAQVSQELDRTPTDFTVLSNSEARRLQQFNDDSYHWGQYCLQLGRSIAHSEKRYIFEELQLMPSAGEPIDAQSPQFEGIQRGVQQLISEGYNPDVLCAPISLFVQFVQQSAFAIDWNSSPNELLTVPSGPTLKIFWSSGLAPLNRFVLLDSKKVLWKVKLDPITSHRLTVVIGEPDSPPEAVLFLVETVAKFDILDPKAIHSIPVEGEAEG